MDWKSVWPIPLALGAAVALVGGLAIGVVRAPKDDPALPLARARQYYQNERFMDALDVVNKDLLSFINRGRMTKDQEQELFAIRARSLYYGQERLGIKQEPNFARIVEAYEQGRKRGMVMDPSDISNLAEAYLYVGESGKAIDLARSLANRDDVRQVRLYEKIVAKALKSGDKNVPQVLGLLNEMLEMPKLGIQQRAWVVARQTELRLNAGFAQEAIARLLRDLPKFEELNKEARAELIFLLGKAYAMDVDDDKAREYLAQAEKDLSQFDDRRGEAMVIEGRLLAKSGDNDGAKEKYVQVREGFTDSPSKLEAIVGLAQAVFALGDSEESLKYYIEAIDLVKKSGPQRGVNFISIGDLLRNHYEEKMLKNDPVEALQFAQRAEIAYKLDNGGAGNIPSDLHVNLAQANRRLAENLLREASGITTGTVTPADVSPVTATQAKGYLLDAGAHFREHARATVATNYEQSMESLFSAGDCFDLAGDAPSAIEAFSAFLGGARDSFPRRPEAMFRLAQVHESLGDYMTAASWYDKLISQRNGTATDRGAAALADQSIVPLARCYINEPRLGGTPPATAPDSKPNEERAMELLKQVVAGRFGTPESAQRQDATYELGDLYYKRHQFKEAIDLFTDYMLRYKDAAAKSPSLMFKLADSYRLWGLELGDSMANEALAERAFKAASRQHHLQAARRFYQDVAKAVAQRGGRASKLEKIYQRNATFYIGDCSYLLGDYEQAVQEYARAREQYANDPSALMAMVQTVSAFIRLERWEDARTANERAKGLLAAIPDDVWSNTERMLPMERRHWEGWLAARLEIDQHAAQTAPGNSASAETPASR